MPSYHTQIITDPIGLGPSSFDGEEGAEVQFVGVVRGSEDGKSILGIEYTAYVPMAERLLVELCERGASEHGPHQVEIQHRIGFVATNEPSIIIRVKTKHSSQSFDLCRWYLKEVKTSVPIWKKAVFAETA